MFHLALHAVAEREFEEAERYLNRVLDICPGGCGHVWMDVGCGCECVCRTACGCHCAKVRLSFFSAYMLGVHARHDMTVVHDSRTCSAGRLLLGPVAHMRSGTPTVCRGPSAQKFFHSHLHHSHLHRFKVSTRSLRGRTCGHVDTCGRMVTFAPSRSCEVDGASRHAIRPTGTQLYVIRHHPVNPVVSLCAYPTRP